MSSAQYLQPDAASQTATTGQNVTSDKAGTVPRPKRVRLHHLRAAKAEGRKLTMLTAYDALTARIFDEAGVDMLLVGDSVGNVMLGYSSTLPVTIDDMVHHVGAVARGTSRALIVGDMPFGSYEADAREGYANAARLMKAGAHAIKLEGGAARVEAVRTLTAGAIPVMGHLGYTPQSEHALGGPRMQGRGEQRAQMLADALALQEAGVFALVLEMVPADIAAEITQALDIPTIGIGAGPDTDGQVLVWSDMAGMTEWTPRFVRRFAELGTALKEAAADYIASVENGSFPSEDHYHAQ